MASEIARSACPCHKVLELQTHTQLLCGYQGFKLKSSVSEQVLLVTELSPKVSDEDSLEAELLYDTWLKACLQRTGSSHASSHLY